MGVLIQNCWWSYYWCWSNDTRLYIGNWFSFECSFCNDETIWISGINCEWKGCHVRYIARILHTSSKSKRECSSRASWWTEVAHSYSKDGISWKWGSATISCSSRCASSSSRSIFTDSILWKCKLNLSISRNTCRNSELKRISSSFFNYVWTCLSNCNRSNFSKWESRSGYEWSCWLKYWRWICCSKFNNEIIVCSWLNERILGLTKHYFKDCSWGTITTAFPFSHLNNAVSRCGASSGDSVGDWRSTICDSESSYTCLHLNLIKW